MQLEILEDSQNFAAGNMASDSLLLKAYPRPNVVRFRHYSWAQPAYSFGKLQSYEEAKKHLKTIIPKAEWVRRPSAGGLVEHTDDWTYSLVLPRLHPLALAPACESYMRVHQALQKALKNIGITSHLQPCPGKENVKATRPRVCFDRAEVSDLIDNNGAKLAGAAQQRTQEGLLLQGSIAKNKLAKPLDGYFKEQFCNALKEALKLIKMRDVGKVHYPEASYQESVEHFGF